MHTVSTELKPSLHNSIWLYKMCCIIAANVVEMESKSVSETFMIHLQAYGDPANRPTP